MMLTWFSRRNHSLVKFKKNNRLESIGLVGYIGGRSTWPPFLLFMLIARRPGVTCIPAAAGSWFERFQLSVESRALGKWSLEDKNNSPVLMAIIKEQGARARANRSTT